MSFKEDLKSAILSGDTQRAKDLVKSELVETTINVYRNGRTYQRRQMVSKDQVSTKTGGANSTKPDESKIRSKKPNMGGSSKQKGTDLDTKRHFVGSSKLKGKHSKFGESGGFSYVKFLSLRKNRDEALKYLDKHDVTWEESDNEGVNWIRACKSAKNRADKE